jgi:predicted ArsR family transcriptional regulator
MNLADFTYANSMKPQTRQLVRLLADDVPGRMINALRQQPRTAPQLEEVTGAAQKTVAHVLELLHAHGIVECHLAETGTPGRPSRLWRLAADEELATFERGCDDFKALMLRRQLDGYDSGPLE